MTPFKISDQTHLILLGLPLSRCRILLFCSILQNVKYHTRSNNTYMLHSAALCCHINWWGGGVVLRWLEEGANIDLKLKGLKIVE